MGPPGRFRAVGVLLTRRCPVCEGTSGTVIHRMTFLAPKELHAPDAVDIASCDRCGACFSDLPVTQSAVDDAYRDHSKYADTSLYDGGEQPGDEPSDRVDAPPPTDAPWDLTRLAGTARWLADHVPTSGRVLDAGCASGALLGFLLAEGFTDIAGLDPSTGATALARANHGVPVWTGSFLDPPPDLGTFDVVVLSHTLEHLVDVRAAIRGMWSLTRPGGHVYIEVPDASRYADHLVAPFNDFNTEHINHFSPQVLRLAMELQGFETTCLETKEVLCSPTDPYPAVYGLFRRPDQPRRAPEIVPDTTLAEALRRYVEASTRLLEDMAAHVRRSAAGRAVVVWGAGQLAMKLLAGPLDGIEVRALVDTSSNKWGQHFGDLVVSAPDDLRAGHLGVDDAPVLVTSVHHERSIQDTIRRADPARSIILLRP